MQIARAQRCSQADGRYKIMARKLVFSRIFYPAQAQWQSYLRVPSHQSRKTCRQDATADCIPSPRSKPHRVRRYRVRSEEHTSELQSLMCISYAVFCFTKKITL